MARRAVWRRHIIYTQMNALVVQEREWSAPYVAEEREWSGREEGVVCVAMAVDGGERREGMKQNNFYLVKLHCTFKGAFV